MTESMTNRERVGQMLAEGSISREEHDDLIAAMDAPSVEASTATSTPPNPTSAPPRQTSAPSSPPAASLIEEVEAAAKVAGETIKGFSRGLKEGLGSDPGQGSSEAIGRTVGETLRELGGWLIYLLFMVALIAGFLLALFIEPVGIPLMLVGIAVVGMFISKAWKSGVAVLVMLILSPVWFPYTHGISQNLGTIKVFIRSSAGRFWPLLKSGVFVMGYALLVICAVSVVYLCVIAALDHLEKRKQGSAA